MNEEVDTRSLVLRARRCGIVIPAFNIPYLPMMEPVVRALHDCNSFGLVMVARLEWLKFQAGSLRAVRDEYRKVGDRRHTRLHLDHVPVIDEDNRRVDFEHVIGEALDLGYESVMVDGSRLPLAENIACTHTVVRQAAGMVPVEAELGAVLGHESGPLPPYEEIFAARRGFTVSGEAARFVAESGADWLSVAIGNIHGAISAAAKQREKPRARLDLEHLSSLHDAVGIPLVLHGGSGIDPACVLEGIRRGIAKINVATAIRQPYERALERGVPDAQDEVYRTMCALLTDELRVKDSCVKLQTCTGVPALE